MEAGGIYFVEIFGFYVFGRAIGSSTVIFEIFMRKWVKVLAAFAILAWIESTLKINIVYEILNLNYHIMAAPRFGLERAHVSLPHPILYGLYASSFLALYMFSMNKQNIRTWLLFTLATVPALSSAPLLSLSLQTMLLVWNAIFYKYNWRWKAILGLFLAMYVFVSLVSNRPFVNILISYLTFNSGTGYYRIAIWEYGWAEVLRHPLFGMGIFDDWIRAAWMHSKSIDNYWLLMMMRHGLPGFLAILVLVLLISKRMNANKNDKIKLIKQGWIISLLSFILVGATVAIWASSVSIFALFLGIGASIAHLKFITKTEPAEVV